MFNLSLVVVTLARLDDNIAHRASANPASASSAASARREIEVLGFRGTSIALKNASLTGRKVRRNEAHGVEDKIGEMRFLRRLPTEEASIRRQT